MAQDLTVNIKTTSDVPAAMDKAKSAVVSFDKQVQDIQKKFSTGFKDIFLSYLGPMALLGAATAFIGKVIEDNARKQQEANKAAIDGTNELMSAEDRYYANKRNNEKTALNTVEQAKIARAEVTKEFLKNDPRGQKIFDNAFTEKTFGQPFRQNKPGLISDDPEIQAKVQAIIAEDARKNPQLGVNPSNLDKAKAGTFKGPEGFSNVVGVGANPVVEAMTAQLEEAKKTNELLSQLLTKDGGFDWMNQTTPSR